MSVYVDSACWRVGRLRTCHMLADTQSELLTMARAIGVNERWLQYPGTPKEHFDIASSKRLLALRLGAVEVSRHFVARFLREKRAGKVAA